MVDQAAQNRLFHAAQKGDKAAIRALVLDDIDFDARDAEDRTAFNIATQHGHAEAAQTILAARQLQFRQKSGLTVEGFAIAHQQSNTRRAA